MARAAARAASALSRLWRESNGSSSSTRSPWAITTWLVGGASHDAGATRWTSPAGPKRTTSSVAQVRLEHRLVSGDDATPPAAARAARPSPAPRPRGADELQMHRPDRRDHADVGLRDPRQLVDLPEPAHAHLEHEHLGALRRGEHGQREPDLGVEVRRVRRDPRRGAMSAASSCFVEVLPTEPVTPITAASSSRRHAVASRCSAASGSSAASTAPPESPAACSGETSTPHAPAPKRIRSEPPAVHVLAGQARRTGRPATARACRSRRA